MHTLIMYTNRAHFSVPETVESICVAICLRSNHKMTGLRPVLLIQDGHSSHILLI